MNITNARYADSEKTAVLADVDGRPSCIPVDPNNRHYQELIAARAAIGPFIPAN